MSFQTDVIVVGWGGAGAVAAIEAADQGAEVLLIEKTAHPGGTTMLAGGYMRVANDAVAVRPYLDRINGGRVSQELVETLAKGMVEVPDYLRFLAASGNAEVEETFAPDLEPNQISDLYDWPGAESLGWAGIKQVYDFEGYPWVNFARRGQNYIRLLERNIEKRSIKTLFNSRAESLIVKDGAVEGLRFQSGTETTKVRARKGVILATGGFQFNARMLRDFLEIPEIHGIGHPGATGDGISLATQAGASLWHMWHVHGSYGFKFPEFPMGFRIPLGGARWNNRPVAWILVDQNGNRFMNEVPPAPQDSGYRPLQSPNQETGKFERVPCWMLFDQAGLDLGPIARPIASVPEHYYEWSSDNKAEVERGWIQKSDTLGELARKIDIPITNLLSTVDTWNAHCTNGIDPDYHRPAGTFHNLKNGPFYAVEVKPVLSNTQGGPKHDAYQRVLDAKENPIPGLYAAGELGSFFGHIYLLGGNLSEGLIGGRIAAQHATSRI